MALTAAGVLAIAEAYLQPRSRDPTVILGYADGPLLVMIGGLFVVIAARASRGCRRRSSTLRSRSRASASTFDSPKDVCVFAILVLVLSNICSNVPTVMLLSGQMMKLDPSIVETGWVILAFSSTVAGNLTLVGSIANLIVAEKAARTGYEFTFFRHLAFAFPTTLVFALAGSLLLEPYSTSCDTLRRTRRVERRVWAGACARGTTNATVYREPPEVRVCELVLMP